MEIDNWYQAVINHLENLAITHTKIIPKWVRNKYYLLVDMKETWLCFCPLFVIKVLLGESEPFQLLNPMFDLTEESPSKIILIFHKILPSLIWIILGKMVSDCTLIWSAEISMNNENIVQTMITTNPSLHQPVFDNWEHMNLYSALSKWDQSTNSSEHSCRWLSSSGPGRGQVQVKKLRNWPEPYNIFGFHYPPPTLHHKLFSWLLRGLYKSDGPRMGWYDSSWV